MNSILKRQIYAILSTILGRKSILKTRAKNQSALPPKVKSVLLKHATQNFCIALKQHGKTTFMHSSLVNEHTPFRLASITKFVVTIIVLRLHEEQKININEDISLYLGTPIQNPNFPSTPITIAHILSHTSSIADGQKYFNAFHRSTPFLEILEFANTKPGSTFLYSNFAYGLLEIILEKTTKKSLEELLQHYIATPLKLTCTFFPTQSQAVPSIYRVFPKRKKPNFIVDSSLEKANETYRQQPLEQRYLKSAGALCMSANGLLRIAETLQYDFSNHTHQLLSKQSIALMQAKRVPYPKKERTLFHGLGTLIMEDERIAPFTLYGHQGFAYGSVNALFFNFTQNFVFVSLNSGTKEHRYGHFSVFTEELLQGIIHG